jgi:hypothetical protein
MKKLVLVLFCFISISLSFSWKATDSGIIAAGAQPQISVDPTGTIRVVLGRNDSVFCATSVDQGSTFSTPVLVARVSGMHLGMARGPQIASSAKTSLITAMDKSGDIHFFQLDNKIGKWESKGYVNDLRSSAPEGLMGLAADKMIIIMLSGLIPAKRRKTIYIFPLLARHKKYGQKTHWFTSRPMVMFVNVASPTSR